MNKHLMRLLALAAVVNCVYSAPTFNRTDLKKTAKFLLDFDYLDLSKPSEAASAFVPNSPSFIKAISRLQWFGNINVTGKLDSKTLELINTDRCGVKDPRPPTSRGASVGEFNLQGTSWKKAVITFKIVNYTPDIKSRSKQRQIFLDALKKWQDASGITLREVSRGSPADIPISFVTSRHGDDYPFDGPGGTLAHAFYPHDNAGLSGDAHFDDDERFTTGTSDGINLDWVAVHEFGHSLGLEHSNVRESIMYPWYPQDYVPDIKLTDDDKKGIQALYPKPTARQTPPTKRTTTKATTTRRPLVTRRPVVITRRPVVITPRPAVPDVCSITIRYDTVFVGPGPKKLTYFFVGDQFFTVNRLLARSVPKTIKSYWSHIKTPVDAAYLNKRGNIVFFKGSEFWEYASRRILRSGNIKLYGLPPDLADMDAVFTYSNGKTYFFKGKQYWRYNERTRRVDQRRGKKIYPRPIKGVWGNDFPVDIDAAFRWVNKKMYLFQGRKYLRLQKRKISNRPVKYSYVARGYPRDIAKIWMKCTDTSGRLSVGGLVTEP